MLKCNFALHVTSSGLKANYLNVTLVISDNITLYKETSNHLTLVHQCWFTMLTAIFMFIHTAAAAAAGWEGGAGGQ